MPIGWGAFGNLQAAQEAAQRALDPNAAQRREAEDIINRDGKGVCEFCKEDIVKSEHSPGGGWTWESEFMLGFCHGAKDKKHHPIIRYTKEGGVQNVETRDCAADCTEHVTCVDREVRHVEP